MVARRKRKKLKSSLQSYGKKPTLREGRFLVGLSGFYRRAFFVRIVIAISVMIAAPTIVERLVNTAPRIRSIAMDLAAMHDEGAAINTYPCAA